MAGAAAMLAMVACNSSGDEPQSVEFEWADVTVTAFSLSKNDKILANLDSVFFAIDLVNARIYNPDSLPKGTVPDRIVIQPTYSTVSKAEIKYKTPEGADSVRTFNASDNDSLDFSQGPVSLILTSLDEKVVRSYTIQINVHQMEPDSLAWGELAYASLPAGIVSEHTTVDGETPVMFAVGYDGQMTMRRSSTDDLVFGEAEAMGTFPEGGDINTVSFLDSKIYMVVAGSLCRYDGADSWTYVTPMTWVYGEYDGRLLGNCVEDGRYIFCSWPEGERSEIPDGMPVSGTSNMIVYTSRWADRPMAMLVGGNDASSSKVAGTWAYDGDVWADIALQPLPAASGVAIIPYFTFRTSNQWVITERTTLLAIGGLTDDSTIQGDVYVSFDRGMHWDKGQDLVQLPEYIKPRHSAQAVVLPRTMSLSRGTGVWTPCELPPFPRWYAPLLPRSDSRVTSAVTEWECPYIYLIGGMDTGGSLCREIWRGVINRLTFTPLY